MRKVAGYIMHKGLSRGWVCWYGKWEERQENLEAMARSMSHMKNAKVAKCWNVWVKMALGPDPMANAIWHFEHRQVLQGWTGWASFVFERTAMMRGARHLLNRTLSFGFGRWSGYVSARSEAMQKLTMAVNRMQKGTLTRGLVSWRAAMAFSDRDAALKQAAASMLAGELSKGWRKWSRDWEAQRTAKEKMTSCLQHLLNRKLSLGYRSWREMAEARAAFTLKLKRGLAFITNGKLLKAMNQWRSQVSHRARSERRNRDRQMGRAAAHFMSGNLPKGMAAWSSWWEEVTHKKACEELQRRCLARMRNADLAKGFDVIKEIFETKRKMLKALSAMVNRALYRSLSTWNLLLQKAKEQEAKREETMKKAGVFLMNAPLRELKAGCSKWAAHVAEITKQRMILYKALNRNMNAAWNTWWEMVKERREALQSMRKVAGRFQNRALTRGWLPWLQQWNRAGGNLRKVAMNTQSDLRRKVAMRMLNRGLSVAFATWVMRREEVRLMRRACARMLQMSVAVRFEKWNWLRKRRLALCSMVTPKKLPRRPEPPEVDDNLYFPKSPDLFDRTNYLFAGTPVVVGVAVDTPNAYAASPDKRPRRPGDPVEKQPVAAAVPLQAAKERARQFRERA